MNASGILRTPRVSPISAVSVALWSGFCRVSRVYSHRLCTARALRGKKYFMSTHLQPEEERAMQYALRLLGYRARSEAEMRSRLARKGFAVPVTDHTLAELTRLNLLDDREFARNWVACRRDGRGPARLRQELRVKGIDRDLAEESIVTGLSAEEELAAAWAVAQRATRAHALPLAREEVLRIRRLLLRRGFTSGAVHRVCARLNDHATAEGDWLE